MMLTNEEFVHECHISSIEVSELTDDELERSFQNFKDPTFVRRAMARGEKFFGESVIYLIAINYFAVKGELIRRSKDENNNNR